MDTAPESTTKESKLDQIPLGFRLLAKEKLQKAITLHNPLLMLDLDKTYINIARGSTISSETLIDALLKKSIGEEPLLNNNLAGLYLNPTNVNLEDQIQGLNPVDLKNIIDRLSTTLVNTYRDQVDNFWQIEDLSIPQELRVNPVNNLLKNLVKNSSLIERVYQVDTMYPNLKQTVISYFSKKIKDLTQKDIHPDTVQILLFNKGQENSHPPFLSFDLTNFALNDYLLEWSFLQDSSESITAQIQISQDIQNLRLGTFLQKSDILTIKSKHQAKLERFWQKNFNNYRMLAKFSYLRALFEQQNSIFKLSEQDFELALQAAGFGQEEISALTDLKQDLRKVPSDLLETPSIPNYVEVSSFIFNNQISSDILKIRSIETNRLLLYIPGHTPSFVMAKREHLLMHWIFREVESPDKLSSVASHFPHSSRMIDKIKLDAFLYQDYSKPEENVAPRVAQGDIFSFITERQKERAVADLYVDISLVPSFSFYSASILNYQSTDSALFGSIAAAIEYIPHLLPNIHTTSSDLHEFFPDPYKTASEFMKTEIKKKLSLDIDPDKTFIRFSLRKVKPIYYDPILPVLKSEVRISIQSLTEAALNNYQAGYSPFGFTTIIYQDPSGKGEYISNEQLLNISPEDVEEIIQKADLDALHKSKLDSFWGNHTDRMKYFIKHRYLQQALEAYQNKTLSEENFKLLSEVAFYSLSLEEEEFPYPTNPNISIEIMNIAGYTSTDMFLFRDTYKQQVILYIAGNTKAFFTFTDYEECICFLEENAKKNAEWQKLLSSHFSMDVQEAILSSLKLGPHIRGLILINLPHLEPVDCSFENALFRHPITKKPIEKSFFEVIQKNIQERSYLDANVIITSDEELILKEVIAVVKAIEMVLLVPSFAFPILNWVSLAALVTETALNLYIAKNGDTVKERHLAAIDAGISSLEFLLIGAFVNFRSLKFSKNQSLSEISIEDQGRLRPLTAGSGMLSFFEKTPVSEEIFFDTTKSMQAWRIAAPESLFSHLDVKAWFLDEQFLLFTGKTSKAKHLIISAHGGYFPGSGIVKVPDSTELVVLGPHGWQIFDPKTSKVAKGLVLPYGIINEGAALPSQTAFHPSLFSRSSNIHVHPHPTNIKLVAGTDVPGHIRNYSLAKYQKFGAGQENYLDIAQIVTHSRHPFPNVYEMGFKPVDVLTIRNRRGIIPPNLEDVFKALKSHGIHYDKITLEFCRSNILSSMFKTPPRYTPVTL